MLGLSAFFHDSAAALLKDGNIVAAAQEERFSRIKHDSAFPRQAISYCLQEAGIGPSEIDYVSYYEKPLLKLDRLLSSYLHQSPRGLASFLKAMPVWLNQKLYVEKEIDQALRGRYHGPIGYCTHHQAHGASAFFPSPFTKAAIITMDGVGEWDTTTWGVGRHNAIELTHSMTFPNSLGLLYSAFTQFLGFKVNSGEYKVMGLAPYGEPKYTNLILENIIALNDDGSFALNMEYFNFVSGLSMISDRFQQLFGRPARQKESSLTESDMDIAASIQKVVELAMVNIARHVKEQTGETNLCLAGGVALNCVGNGKILETGLFNKIWVQPAAGDAGSALGAALFQWYQQQNQPRIANSEDSQQGSLLGPAYSASEIASFLKSVGAVATKMDDQTLCDHIASEIAEGKVVGFFQGRMEYGPRALGSRSILGDARSANMQQKMNLKIKFRESFRPFAPSCLEEDRHQFFAIKDPSPYMLMVAPLKPERLKPLPQESAVKGLQQLRLERSDLPAITHVDSSARVQTVNKERFPRFHQLLESFKKTTGEGILINTSFNVRGEPIVMSPKDAYDCFMRTEMDILVLENYVCYREAQPTSARPSTTHFPLD